jgi:dihydroneopterin aldolase
MTTEHLDGLIPEALTPRSRRIFFEGMEVLADIGFHDFEIGVRQRLLLSIDVWVDKHSFAGDDAVSSAWNYDTIRTEVLRLVKQRRYNLQETLVGAIYRMIAARAGVTALRVSTRKPDIYPDCDAVGVELSSF